MENTEIKEGYYLYFKYNSEIGIVIDFNNIEIKYKCIESNILSQIDQIFTICNIKGCCGPIEDNYLIAKNLDELNKIKVFK